MREVYFKVFNFKTSKMYELKQINICKMNSKKVLKDKIYLQYAGVVDINNEKIYEGDIVRLNSLSNETGYITFSDGAFIYNIFGKDDYRLLYNILHLKLEVIGNIYIK